MSSSTDNNNINNNNNNDETTWESFTEQDISAVVVLFSTLLALVIVLSKLLHDYPISWLPEAGMVLLVGIIASFVVNLFIPNVVPPNNADYYGEDIDDDAINENNENNENNEDIIEDDSVVAQSLLSFSPEIFFIALLPPIIFNSGYHLRRELFFRHFTPIALFAVVGTIISAFTIAFVLEIVKGFGLIGNFKPTFTELLTFGGLISATDPVSTLAVFQVKCVDPHLFYLVFGESVLNDAVGLVLFDAFSKFVVKDNGAGKVVIGVSEFIIGFLLDSVGSPILGILCGCGGALLFKHIDMRNNRLLELSLYVLIMYVPFLLATILRVSGIVTILFCGMTARAYIVPNLSQVTTDDAETFFRLFAYLAETSIFLELGLSVFGLRGSVHMKFILWSLLACIIGRAFNIYPITFLYNQRLRTEPKTHSEHAAERRLMKIKKKSIRNNNNNESQVELTANNTSSSSDLNVSITDENTTTTTTNNNNNDTTTRSGIMLSNNITTTPTVRKDLRISYNQAHMMCFSGLRGAVAYACVRSFPDTFGHQTEFIVTTMVIVLITVFLFGGTTSLMLRILNIDMNVNEEEYMVQWHEERKTAAIVLKLEDAIQRNVVRQQDGLQSLSPTSSTSIHNNNNNNNNNSVQTTPIRHSTSMDYHIDGGEVERHFQHMDDELLSSPAYSPTQSSPSPRKKASLYDYGKKG